MPAIRHERPSRTRISLCVPLSRKEGIAAVQTILGVYIVTPIPDYRTDCLEDCYKLGPRFATIEQARAWLDNLDELQPDTDNS